MFNVFSLALFLVFMWPDVFAAFAAWAFFTLILKPDDWKF